MTDVPGIRHIAVRGGLIALAVSAVLGVVVFAAVVLITGNTNDALRPAAYMALGYLALNLIVLGVGLVARPSGAWAIGAALATPVILAAIGFGYTIFLARPL
jgi:hypothetical protein